MRYFLIAGSFLITEPIVLWREEFLARFIKNYTNQVRNDKLVGDSPILLPACVQTALEKNYHISFLLWGEPKISNQSEVWVDCLDWRTANKISPFSSTTNFGNTNCFVFLFSVTHMLKFVWLSEVFVHFQRVIGKCFRLKSFGSVLFRKLQTLRTLCLTQLTLLYCLCDN